ncbi:hypothetical protein QL285_050427 [Trifolium repens]|nr:hypothetical protein QL285_050427 [Trifolium repens]
MNLGSFESFSSIGDSAKAVATKTKPSTTTAYVQPLQPNNSDKIYMIYNMLTFVLLRQWISKELCIKFPYGLQPHVPTFPHIILLLKLFHLPLMKLKSTDSSSRPPPLYAKRGEKRMN